MELYFLRHGETNFNEDDFSRPLTYNGQEQVNILANTWKDENIKFDKIIVSPYRRTIETAELIGSILGCSLEIDDEWAEINNELPKDMAFQQTNEGFKLPIFENLFGYGKLKGESYWNLHSRSMVALEKVLQYRLGKYLIVAHGGILNAAIRMIIGAQPPVKGNGLYFQFGHLGYIRIEYKDTENMWIIKEFNMGKMA